MSLSVSSSQHSVEVDSCSAVASSYARLLFLMMLKARWAFIVTVVGFLLLYWHLSSREPESLSDARLERFVNDAPSFKETPGGASRASPLIFIGGMPRSGTTLMRAMLDAHPSVRCGEETRVVPRILGLRAQWRHSEKEWMRLQEAGVTSDVIDDAVSSFIIKVIAGHGAPAPRLCNKDPFTMKSAVYLKQLFPNGRFLFMIRDGRATVHSIITRKVTITGFNLNDWRQCLTKWNAAVQVMLGQCEEAGDRCLKVWYEQLVLHPRTQMQRILKHLDLPWNETVMHHEELVGSKKISVSKVERTTDQIVYPVNPSALSKWVGQIPPDVVRDMAEVAPMLEQLGYDPQANPPNYGTPDKEVLDKVARIANNSENFYKKAVQLVADPDRVQRPDQNLRGLRIRQEQQRQQQNNPEPVAN